MKWDIPQFWGIDKQKMGHYTLSNFVPDGFEAHMTPPRRKSAVLGRGREFKIRLPEDITRRIEAKANVEQRPQNRIIINELASFPELEKTRRLASLIGDMEVVLARYAAQITLHDLSDALLKAIDTVLAAQGAALPTAIERLRVARAGMLAHVQIRDKQEPAVSDRKK
jgi:hypothetical protein